MNRTNALPEPLEFAPVTCSHESTAAAVHAAFDGVTSSATVLLPLDAPTVKAVVSMLKFAAETRPESNGANRNTINSLLEIRRILA
ncbi:MAG TPA: hypothetical protein VKX17_06115 [Planctomycetota bacterium]|nr:hypothetical protein [Planctomycetota bacterium]